MQIKYLLIVKPAAGLNIWDTPRPQGQGAIKRRTETKGAQLYAYDIHYFEGVPYARLVPRDPTRPEWARVSERGSATPEYVDVIQMESEQDLDLGSAINKLAASIEKLAEKLAEK